MVKLFYYHSEGVIIMKYYDECYFVHYDSYQDLRLSEIGCQKCSPEYSYGPTNRENYVLHYIIDGKGTLFMNKKEFPVHSKEAFITPPHTTVFYKADKENPWHYLWIHFNGSKSSELLYMAGITKENPIFTPTHMEKDLETCLFNFLLHRNSELLCIGDLYHLFQYLINLSSNKPKPEQIEKNLKHIKNSINYINQKFSEPIKIQDIANYCGLDRSYLCKIFKLATNYSPQEYLIHYRIRKAKQYLSDDNMMVQDVAYAVGYPDSYAFSKLFKKKTGLSPSQYRSKQIHTSKTPGNP